MAMTGTTFSCPTCQRLLKVNGAAAVGKKVRCPRCATVFVPPPLPLPEFGEVMAEPGNSQGECATLPPAPPGDLQAATLPPSPLGNLEAATLPPLDTHSFVPSPQKTEPAADDGASSSATTVPGYEILGELGRGGMGVVYKARHIQLQRLVALKMILAGGHAGAAELARFRTEAEAIARLQHANIVQIHEVSEHEGKPYFSLEFCGGGSLAQKIDGTPFPPRAAARMVETLARGMNAAHQKGIIHRDLKPANVLLLEDGTPKITDFGLAKKLDDVGQTQSGAIMGTPSYMAPEQTGGKTKMGPAADIYALGAILYELLTGRPPFKAATPLDTVLQVVSDDPVPPTQLQSKTPKDLETICLKCLEKEPRKRYASAADLAEDLRRFQEGEPILTRPVGSAERLVKWVKRRPVVAALLAAVLLVTVTGVGGITWAMALALEERDKAQALLLRAEWLVYAGRIGLAQREWQDNNVAIARDLLDSCRPDLRGWEHNYLYTLLNSNQRTFRGHTSPVTSVAESPDGKRIVSGSYDTTVKVWDASTGQETLNLKGHTGYVGSLAFSADGKRIVSGSSDETVKVWDASTGQDILTLKGHTRAVTSVAFSPDAKRIISGSEDGTVKVWDGTLTAP